MQSVPARVGAMRDRIVFRRRFMPALPTTQGVALKEPQDVSPAVWASVIPIRSGEEIVAGRLSGVTGYRIRCRYMAALADLKPSDIAEDARDADRKWRIRSVIVDKIEGWLDIVAEAGIGA